MFVDNVICPICGEKLNVVDKTAACKNRHSFDRAREGYFYLLPPNAKRSLSPGDNRDMVAARAEFLATDSYLPLAKTLADIIDRRYPSTRITLLDAGVGTGYYLSLISRLRGDIDDCVGADISKEAVRRAARANKGAFIAVANVFSLPIADDCVDVVLSVFSPFADREISRTLKVGGLLLAVVPGKNHLIELREALYPTVRPVEGDLASAALSLISVQNLTYTFDLANSAQISSLLAMTPYAYRAPKDSVLKVKSCAHMALTADFEIYTFQKQ